MVEDALLVYLILIVRFQVVNMKPVSLGVTNARSYHLLSASYVKCIMYKVSLNFKEQTDYPSIWGISKLRLNCWSASHSLYREELPVTFLLCRQRWSIPALGGGGLQESQPTYMQKQGEGGIISWHLTRTPPIPPSFLLCFPQLGWQALL